MTPPLRRLAGGVAVFAVLAGCGSEPPPRTALRAATAGGVEYTLAPADATADLPEESGGDILSRAYGQVRGSDVTITVYRDAAVRERQQANLEGSAGPRAVFVACGAALAHFTTLPEGDTETPKRMKVTLEKSYGPC